MANEVRDMRGNLRFEAVEDLDTGIVHWAWENGQYVCGGSGTWKPSAMHAETACKACAGMLNHIITEATRDRTVERPSPLAATDYLWVDRTLRLGR